jgi:outer membrane immunogenic protein
VSRELEELRMRVFAISSLAVCALTRQAMAADVAPPLYKIPAPITSRSSCYVGADAGAAWSSQDLTNAAPLAFDQAGVVGTINGAGPVGGGYAGCNFRVAPAWVVGIEGDFSATHLGGTANAPNVLASGAPAAS